MAIDSVHPKYAEFKPVWKKVRDVLGGQRKVHEATTEYLPRLGGQQDPSYRNYVMRADFTAITQRSHDTLSGFLFRKDPTYKFPDALADFMLDCTLSGLSFADWLKDTAAEVLGVGRRGTLVDWNNDFGRPFLSVYEAEQIINWKTQMINGQLALSLLVLTEDSSDPSPLSNDQGAVDQFEHVTYPQWRVYELLPADGPSWYVRCQVWRKKKGGGSPTITTGVAPGTGPAASENFVLISESFPARGGVTLGRIPFVFHGPNNHLPAIDQCPMESMADLNLSHYRDAADHAHGLHFVALPTPTARGFGEDAEKLPIGPEIAWVSDKQYAQAAYLEFSGTGLTAFVTSMEKKEERMAGLGARMFDAPKGRQGAEAYDTVHIRQTGETVTLVNVAIALIQSGGDVLQWAAWWFDRGSVAPEQLAEQAAVEISTEFIQTDVQPDALTALVAAWTGQAISRRTMYYRLDKSEFYPPDWSYDDEVKAIMEDAPTPVLPAADTSGGTGGGPTTGNGGGAGSGAASGGGGQQQ